MFGHFKDNMIGLQRNFFGYFPNNRIILNKSKTVAEELI